MKPSGSTTGIDVGAGTAEEVEAMGGTGVEDRLGVEPDIDVEGPAIGAGAGMAGVDTRVGCSVLLNDDAG